MVSFIFFILQIVIIIGTVLWIFEKFSTIKKNTDDIKELQKKIAKLEKEKK